MSTSQSTSIRTTKSESVSEAVVSAVAAVTGIEPTQLEPLYHILDPDALDQLFETPARSVSRAEGRVDFTMAGCEVTVYANGEVEVVPPTGSADTSLE